MIGHGLSSNLGIQILFFVVGLAVLLVGRKLFWLAVAALGFVLGLAVGFQLTDGQTDWLVLLVALLGGVIGAVLAIWLQKIAVAIAGLFLGGYLAVWLAEILGFSPTMWTWLIFIVGGIAGAILVLSLLEVALIGVTTLVGAALLVQVFPLSLAAATILFMALVIVGIVIQTQSLSRDSRGKPSA
jgi:hypothetical protein